MKLKYRKYRKKLFSCAVIAIKEPVYVLTLSVSELVRSPCAHILRIFQVPAAMELLCACGEGNG